MTESAASSTLDCAIVIINWNTRKLTEDCIRSIYAETRKISFEIILVDNASTDGSVEYLSELFPEVRIIRNTSNLGTAKANNIGMNAARPSRFILLLNSDTVVIDGAIDRAVESLERRPDVGALGCQLLNPDGSPQVSCNPIPTLSMYARLYLLPRRERPICDGYHEVGWIVGAFMLVRTDVVRRVGMVPEVYFMYCEDVEWCLHMNRAGYKVCHDPDIRIIHLGGGSSKPVEAALRVEQNKSRRLFLERNYSALHVQVFRVILFLSISMRGLQFLRRLARGERGVRDIAERLKFHIRFWKV